MAHLPNCRNMRPPNLLDSDRRVRCGRSPAAKLGKFPKIGHLQGPGGSFLPRRCCKARWMHHTVTNTTRVEVNAVTASWLLPSCCTQNPLALDRRLLRSMLRSSNVDLASWRPEGPSMPPGASSSIISVCVSKYSPLRLILVLLSMLQPLVHAPPSSLRDIILPYQVEADGPATQTLSFSASLQVRLQVRWAETEEHEPTMLRRKLESCNFGLILKFKPELELVVILFHTTKRRGRFRASVQDWSLQCPSNAIWAFKIYLSQNNPSKRNPKLRNEDVTWNPHYNMPATRTNKCGALSLQEVELDGWFLILHIVLETCTI